MATPTPDDIASDVRERSNTALKRGLASRHMQMIAIGGSWPPVRRSRMPVRAVPFSRTRRLA